MIPMEDMHKKARLLIEALPYIKAFYGKTMVIKYGGSAMEDDTLKHTIAQDIVLMRYVGMNIVVVHGGGKAITETMKKMGKEARFHEGMRITDEETRDIAEMVLVGKINQELVGFISGAGGRAVGLSGKDGNTLIATKYAQKENPRGSKGIDYGFVGQVEKVNTALLETLDEHGYIPVLSPIGVDLEGKTYNINADLVAGEVAASLRAEKLILLTDKKGILRDEDDPTSLLPSLKAKEVRALMEEGCIKDGMIPKVKACLRAIEAGVHKAHIIQGSLPHSLLLEIFTDQGIGTLIEA